MGAGILPTTIKNNTLYFLFGKENERDDTPGWSDFAGGQDGNESQLQTAIREGGEELTGFLGTDKDLKKMMTRFGTYNIDLNERYRTHIFPMEYDEALPHYYNNNQRFLQKRLSEKDMQWLIKKYKIMEKAEIEWVSINDLQRKKKYFRKFYQEMVDLIYEQREKIDAFIKKAVNKDGKFKTKANKTRRRY
jgi:8-oxo-dGTP pyrophosphatase MutT (NUDIX family)